MKFQSAVLGSRSESLGITEKSNMKMGSKSDPRLEKEFKCRLLENFTTNS